MSLNHNKSYNIDIKEWILKNKQYAQYLSTQKLVNRDCPVCQSAEYDYFANNDYLEYSKCRQCSLVFMNPTLDESSVNDGFKGGGRFAYVLF